jgi:hypothetical protein
MAKQVQLRRGTTSEHSTFTGAVGEVTVDTTKDTLVVHDGSTAGGIPLARQSSVDLKAPIASPVFTGDLEAGRLLARGSGGIWSNVAVGANSLAYNTTGVTNIAIGGYALANITIGSANTAIGFSSSGSNIAGDNNMSGGCQALQLNVSGSGNTAIGAYALKYKQDGNQNTDLSYCTGLGYDTRVGGNNATAIGHNASAPANCVALGTSSERTLVGGAVDNGVARLQVNGSIKADKITIGASTSFGFALLGNQDWNTEINANGGGAGKLVTVMLSANWGNEDSTGASFGYIRCGYSGNHATYYNQWASHNDMIPTITVNEAGIIIINVPRGGNMHAFFQTNK